MDDKSNTFPCEADGTRTERILKQNAGIRGRESEQKHQPNGRHAHRERRGPIPLVRRCVKTAVFWVVSSNIHNLSILEQGWISAQATGMVCAPFNAKRELLGSVQHECLRSDELLKATEFCQVSLLVPDSTVRNLVDELEQS